MIGRAFGLVTVVVPVTTRALTLLLTEGGEAGEDRDDGDGDGDDEQRVHGVRV